VSVEKRLTAREVSTKNKGWGGKDTISYGGPLSRNPGILGPKTSVNSRRLEDKKARRGSDIKRNAQPSLARHKTFKITCWGASCWGAEVHRSRNSEHNVESGGAPRRPVSHSGKNSRTGKRKATNVPENVQKKRCGVKV